jgi:Rrf2 family protein
MSASTRFSVAVHLLCALAWLGEQGATSAELAESVNTNPVVLRRVLGQLAEAGLVQGQPGRRGGYTLGKRPERISLRDVYRALGESGPLALHEHPENEACPVSCGIKPLLGGVLERADRALQDELARTRIADLVGRMAARR